ncbi:MAG: FAD-dependent oxidoreductase [Bacteroides sp.]|nr:FAD-dependent oxidoreductase [Bacteroides sp.]
MDSLQEPYLQLPLFFPDGSRLNFYQDKEELLKDLQEGGFEAPSSVFKRLEESREMYQLGAPVFLFSNFHKLSNFNAPPFKKVALKLYKLDFLRTMHQANRSAFRDARLVQLFDHYATYNGSSPYRCPATLNMIAHLENNIGACFPEQGMYSIVDALYRLALKLKVEFRLDTPVKKIKVEEKRVTGVVTNQRAEPLDCLVSAGDVRYTINHLLDNYPYKQIVNRMEPSSSALIFYWGINRTFPELELHNILFFSRLQKRIQTPVPEKILADDLTVYIFISSKIVKTDAPKGCENWFVMVNAPADYGQQWEEMVARASSQIVAIINERLSTDIATHIVTERIATPVDIKRNTLSMQGALYGSSSNSMFSTFLRHPNQAFGIPNLFFVGGTVHPGGGIPLCLASAKIVDEEIAKCL